MSDFPGGLVMPNDMFVASSNDACLYGQAAQAVNGAVSAAVWGTANTCLYIPFQIEVPFVLKTIAIRVSVQSGNCDVGVYTEAGASLVTKGSTAVGAAGMQTFDMTASISHGVASPVIPIGTNYFAINVDNTTASLFRHANGSSSMSRLCGIRQQAVGAVALPTTATFATVSVANIPTWIASGSIV